MNIKELLDAEVLKRDTLFEVTLEKPDPILIAKEYGDERVALISALFGYGNAKLIVKFLSSLDFKLLEYSDNLIKKELKNHYYRFQNSQDISELFITLKRVKEEDSLNSIFLEGYKKEHSILDGLETLILKLYSLNSYRSRGYGFLLGKPPNKKSTSTYKRWNMYLRWMVRKDSIDLGLWSGIDRSNLLMPLDTHTFKVSRALGLLNRERYDLKAVLELTKNLSVFDPKDPVKYDFALYRIGQERDLVNFK